MLLLFETVSPASLNVVQIIVDVTQIFVQPGLLLSGVIQTLLLLLQVIFQL